MRTAFYTFGCKLNQSETEALASAFRSRDFSLVSPDEDADIYVLNTCTVTSKSEQKARRLIRSLARAHPKALLLVTGCYAQLNRPEIKSLAGNVRVLPQEDKVLLLDFPEFIQLDQNGTDIIGLFDRFRVSEKTAPAKDAGEEEWRHDPFRLQARSYSFHSRPLVKIQDGCDNSCAYCRIPLARGRSISLEPETILKRIHALDAQGFGEMVLTGVNISAYRWAGFDLAALLHKILQENLSARIRLSSLEPDQISPEWIQVLSDPRICAHFHIPVQSGSDAVLQRMRRRYRSPDIAAAIRVLRQARKDAFVGADVIVGFPGETEEEFAATRAFLHQFELSQLHVFPFSPRPGTAAEHMLNKVPERVRDRRAQTLLRLSSELHEHYLRRWVGREVAVVLEKSLSTPEETVWSGLSGNYIKVRVSGVPGDSGQQGRLIRVRIERTGDPARGIYLGRVSSASI